jgi:hypothetical protein
MEQWLLRLLLLHAATHLIPVAGIGCCGRSTLGIRTSSHLTRGDVRGRLGVGHGYGLVAAGVIKRR